MTDSATHPSDDPVDRTIFIKGARAHNLKNLDLRIPREQFVVVTGVSGSGKSSLAFDTLYAEGYRKYMDSLSTRARQVLDQMARPDVDYIHGLSPVIAIEQRTGGGANPRSTVGTVTEIADYARLLWAIQAEARCPQDGARIERQSLDDCIARIFREPEGSRLMLLAPVLNAKPALLREELPRLRQRGFTRVRLNGEIRHLDEPDLVPTGARPLAVDLVVDRIVLKADQRSRLADSLELAFEEAGDRALVLVQADRAGEWQEFSVSQHFACTACGEVYEPLTPRHFSWNHIQGACPGCGGLGHILRFNEELVVPDLTKSVKNGAIKPFRLGSKAMIIRRNAQLKQLAEQLPFDPDAPWRDLPEKDRRAILHGAGDRLFSFKLKRGNAKPDTVPWAGVLAELETARRETSSESLKARLMAFQTSAPCPACGGARLAAYPRAARLAGHGFTDFMRRSIDSALVFMREDMNAEAAGRDAIGDALRGLYHRLHFLGEVGLGYLTLDRAYATLSGGEAQRVRLATQLGMGLVGVVYVLDEPSIGLHPIDNRRLIRTLTDLRDRGNSVIVVEHDASTMRAADQLIELGPGAGETGGEIIFQGTPEACQTAERSRTGPFLAGRQMVERSVPHRPPGRGWLALRGCREHNLKGFDVRFPVGLLTAVCGVSGSGKSTLVNDILGRAAAFRLNKAREVPGRHDGLDGLEAFSRVIRVDQEPIGRSPRSNPATFTKLFDQLRDLFARAPLSRVRGYKSSRFSFNMSGGRCERCKGDGAIKLDMQFLADAYATCPSCQGRRYNRETLEVRFKGYSIADVLEMTVDEALALFRRQPKIQEKLQTLQAVGLGYVRLGQSATTLSGGEAQRIKLSLELSKRQQGDTLYILDEPTTGLHWIDVQRLMDLLFQLREAGNTIVVIEHDTDVIRLADWIIELGPEGGEAGGHLVFSGEPADFKDTPTAGCL
ncbi:MAG: excinuclease ABC subunit UvrA [Opitutales bacterium]